MTGIVVGAFLQVAFDRLATPILQDFKRVCGVEEALDGLQKTLNQTRAFLRDADRGTVESEIDRMWLHDLEAAAHEADDIVDEFYYAALRHQVEGSKEGGWTAPVDKGSHGRVRKRDKFKKLLNAIVRPGAYQSRHEMAETIQELSAKFEGITKRHKDLNLGMLTSRASSGRSSPEGGSVRQETSSLVSEYVCGRQAEVEQIVQILLNLDATRGHQPSDSLPASPSTSSSSSFSPSSSTSSSSSFPSTSSSFDADKNYPQVLPIVGIAGLGKTTLAQLICNDNRVTKHFELLMWVSVSNHFDLRRLTRTILESVAPEDKSVVESPNLDVIQRNLRRKLVGKRFLLVLDDLWNHERGEWNKLQASLNRGMQGSAVLVTTRHDLVADAVGTMDPVRLQGLSFDDCNQLLLRCVSVNRNISKPYFSEDVCRKLVEKIRGVPLAIKTLGNILSSKKVDHWEEILERDIWQLQLWEGDILPVLKLSYEDLPIHLKRCFAYCSLFPEDFEFDKLKLVKLWMAQDFIQTKWPTERMEDVGSSYFDELLGRSFFQKVDKHYTMHTLYHGLIQSIPNRQCVRITEQNSTNGVEDDCLLHLSFSTPKAKQLASKLTTSNHLRSFVYTREFTINNDILNSSLELTDSYLSTLKYLRVLDLSSSCMTVLPESVGSLIHLRFLDISHTKVKVLPDSLAQLYNLQCLELKHCQHLQKIPRGVQNLINLRHLNASDDLVITLPGIGKLTSLQELKLFYVSKEHGHRISELKNLNEVRNKLCIRNIQNIETIEEATEANLESKKYLLELAIDWSVNSVSNINPETDADIIEGLQPPWNLKVLSIIGNCSLQPPRWMNRHCVNNLTSIWLRDCRNWKSLPSLGTLSHLEYLKIEYLSGVEEVGPQFYGNGVAFPVLKALEFRHMQSLTVWTMASGPKVFPCLEKLVVEDCPQLGTVAVPSARILKIEKCPKLLIGSNLIYNHPSLHSLSWSFENSYLDLPSCVAHTSEYLCSLEKLEISFCDESETEKRWSQRPSWMPFTYSQGRAADEIVLSNISLNIHDGSDIRVFLFYAYKYPDYPEVHCRNMCLRIRNYDSDNNDGFSSLSTCLQNHLVSLHQLSVKGCDKIEPLLGNKTLSSLKSLTTLDIDTCIGMKSLQWFPKHNFVTLRYLKIANCPDFIHFPRLKLTMLEKFQVENSEGLLSLNVHELISLKFLEILGCSRLKGGSISGRLPVLEELKLRRCSNLILTLDDMDGGLQGLTSLKMLEISLCQNLSKLPANLQALTSLKKLLIMQCPKIKSLPESGLPITLNELRIDGCPLLQRKCQKNGVEWPRVSHILTRTISCSTCSPYKCLCNQL